MANEGSIDTLTLTAEIVASYLGSGSNVQASAIPDLIKSVRAALDESGAPQAQPEEQVAKPDKRAISKSITPDGLISFVDGKSYKTLKRHLGRHGMDMKAYRERYGLPSDYPSTSPNYSASRSEMAKRIGLGAKRRGEAAPAEAPVAAAPAARGRKKAG